MIEVEVDDVVIEVDAGSVVVLQTDGAPLSDDDPHAVGDVNPGTATDASRADHVHPRPVLQGIVQGPTDEVDLNETAMFTWLLAQLAAGVNLTMQVIDDKITFSNPAAAANVVLWAPSLTPAVDDPIIVAWRRPENTNNSEDVPSGFPLSGWAVLNTYSWSGEWTNDIDARVLLMLPGDDLPTVYATVTTDGFVPITVKAGTAVTVQCAGAGFAEGAAVFVGAGGEADLGGGPDVAVDATVFRPQQMLAQDVRVSSAAFANLSGNETEDLDTLLHAIDAALIGGAGPTDPSYAAFAILATDSSDMANYNFLAGSVPSGVAAWAAYSDGTVAKWTGDGSAWGDEESWSTLARIGQAISSGIAVSAGPSFDAVAWVKVINSPDGGSTWVLQDVGGTFDDSALVAADAAEATARADADTALDGRIDTLETYHSQEFNGLTEETDHRSKYLILDPSFDVSNCPAYSMGTLLEAGQKFTLPFGLNAGLWQYPGAGLAATRIGPGADYALGSVPGDRIGGYATITYTGSALNARNKMRLIGDPSLVGLEHVIGAEPVGALLLHPNAFATALSGTGPDYADGTLTILEADGSTSTVAVADLLPDSGDDDKIVIVLADAGGSPTLRCITIDGGVVVEDSDVAQIPWPTLWASDGLTVGGQGAGVSMSSCESKFSFASSAPGSGRGLLNQYTVTGQDISDGTDTVIAFDTTVFAPDALDLTDGVFTVTEGKGGLWDIDLAVLIDASDTDGTRDLWIEHLPFGGGSNIHPATPLPGTSASGKFGGTTMQRLPMKVLLADGDSFSVKVRQDSGSTVAYGAGLSLVRLGSGV